MGIVLKTENISKQYRLGSVGSGSLRDDVHRWWAKFNGKGDPLLKVGETNDRTSLSDSNYVWALKNINFEVEQGDILGVIGKNGAGKSTLLKLLSKVTAPSTGSIKVKGRIASLLEVGTGFHPELTGRENIYLNGAILGMRRHEITNKLDEIVAFAGVERYLDTPVKRYSSGMYVRLAFAVAAHLESEILIIDEVLAVGDSEFQQKCLGKIGDISKGDGRTVLFVSHNMAAVKSLCTKGIVLENGELVYSGSQIEASDFYQNKQNLLSFYNNLGDLDQAIGNEKIKILSFDVRPLIGNIIDISSGIVFELKFFNFLENINLDATFELRSIDDIAVFHQGKILTDKKNSKKGVYNVRGVLHSNLLNAGIYKFSLIFGENQRYVLFNIIDLIQFEVMNVNIGTNSFILPGIIRPNIEYSSSFSSY
jgi:lipopolysaccharide transport system ATP-binding protein